VSEGRAPGLDELTSEERHQARDTHRKDQDVRLPNDQETRRDVKEAKGRKCSEKEGVTNWPGASGQEGGQRCDCQI
jgi:hypothetical protein